MRTHGWPIPSIAANNNNFDIENTFSYLTSTLNVLRCKELQRVKASGSRLAIDDVDEEATMSRWDVAQNEALHGR